MKLLVTPYSHLILKALPADSHVEKGALIPTRCVQEAPLEAHPGFALLPVPQASSWRCPKLGPRPWRWRRHLPTRLPRRPLLLPLTSASSTEVTLPSSWRHRTLADECGCGRLRLHSRSIPIKLLGADVGGILSAIFVAPHLSIHASAHWNRSVPGASCLDHPG